jgi:hypothetical protein
MKTSEQIVEMIKVKQAEHEMILGQITKDVEILRKKLAEMIEAKAAKGVLVQQTQAMMVLKDQAMFHKAAVLVYKDMLEEVNK